MINSVKVEEKLFQNRYVVDEGRPHISISEPLKASPALRTLVDICPAGCWSVQPDGQLSGTLDGCFECGTCRIVAKAVGQEIQWAYPRGGYGILYKFG
ncbi:MAG: ferredoxin family protein [Rhodospirillales bacterium]|nr:MAG: ferredoxin family protein [Rhodospirillales bacterium]